MRPSCAPWRGCWQAAPDGAGPKRSCWAGTAQIGAAPAPGGHRGRPSPAGSAWRDPCQAAEAARRRSFWPGRGQCMLAICACGVAVMPASSTIIWPPPPQPSRQACAGTIIVTRVRSAVGAPFSNAIDIDASGQFGAHWTHLRTTRLAFSTLQAVRCIPAGCAKR